MKRQIPIATFLFACGLGLQACDSPLQGRGAGGERPTAQVQRSAVVLEKRVSVEGRRFFSYAPKERAPTTPEEALARAERLMKLAGSAGFARATEEEKQLPGTIALRSARDSSASLRVDLRTDRILFNSGLADYRELGDTPGLPTRDVAPALALRHARAVGLLPPPNETVLAHVGGLDLGEMEKGVSRTFHKLRVVRFDRQLGELPVVGKSRLIVHLGSQGQLVGIVSDWVPVQARPLEPVEILSDAELQEAIERRLKEDLSGERMVIEQSDLVLWDRGGGMMEPAVRLIGRQTETLPSLREYPYDTVVPVMRRPTLRYPFMHDPRARELIQPEGPNGEGGPIDDGKDD